MSALTGVPTMKMRSAIMKLASMGTTAILVLALLGLGLASPGAASAAPARRPSAPAATPPQQTAAADPDKTLAAMQDELDRSKGRLELKIPGKSDPARPYFIQY